MPSIYTALIVGADRGIGCDLLERYLAQSNQRVIAAVCNPADPTSQELLTLPAGPGSSVVLVKFESAIQSDASNAIKELQDEHNIEYLDLVIADAGISLKYP